MSDSSVIAAVAAFFAKEGISVDEKIVAITAQNNRSGRFGSAIIDFGSHTVAPNFSRANELTLGNVEKRTTSSSGEVIVGYKIGLSRDGVSASTASSELASPDGASFPCCSQMCDYRPQRLDKEELFTSFKNERGSAPGIVFELKTQVDNGPLLRTDYYKLVDGRRIKVSNEYHSKLHAYKNYKCTSHNLFFAVDLRSDSSATYNTHHMRINPFTQNPDVLIQILAEIK